MRFNDINTREGQFQHEQATPARFVFETFISILKKPLYFSLDETVYLTRVGVAFHQHNKLKPGKYRLRFGYGLPLKHWNSVHEFHCFYSG